MPRQNIDPRQTKTRAALLHAFRDLLLQRGFDQFGVAEVAARAQVSRSTLYQHFGGKGGLLAASIAGPFSRLSATLEDADNTVELIALLEHFWGNRALARVLFFGAARRKTMTVLIDQIAEKLGAAGYAKRGRLILPARLAAVQLAEVLLAPVAAWLTGEARCTPGELAPALRQIARGTLASMNTCAARG